MKHQQDIQPQPKKLRFFEGDVVEVIPPESVAGWDVMPWTGVIEEVGPFFEDGEQFDYWVSFPVSSPGLWHSFNDEQLKLLV